MRFNVVVMSGDGVGPEVTAEGMKVLQAAAKRAGHTFNLTYRLIGGAAMDKEGVPITDETIDLCRKADAAFMGAVGDPKYDIPQAPVHPEDGLLKLRASLKVFANLRPTHVFDALADNTNLKPEVVRGVDFMMVRELTGGLYFGRPKKEWKTARGRRAIDTMAYSEPEIERIIRVGFEIARTRKKKLISVDKANVLQTSRLWRQIANELSREYTDVSLEHMLVDSTSMRIIQNPRYLDVLVTENTFGDILTDEASMLSGSMGMAPSASLAGVPKEGERLFGFYEPVHGSAPRRAGQDIINPIATVLTVAMMLRYSFAMSKEADLVEKAVEQVLNEGYRTYDIMSEGKQKVSTRQIGDLIAQKIAG